MKKTVIELNKQLQNLFDFQSLGFQKKEEDNTFYIYSYERNFDNKIDYLSYSFTKDKWKSDLQLMKLNASIVFPEVNHILKEIVKESKIQEFRYLSNIDLSEPTLIDFPLKSLFSNDYSEQLSKSFIVKNKNYDKNSFELSVNIIKEQFYNTILPFFSNIQTLQQVNDEILEKVDMNTYHKYISGETGAKVLIIMKLCNNSKYEDYKERFDKLISEQLNNPNYAQYIDILQSQQIIMNEVYYSLNSGKYLKLNF